MPRLSIPWLAVLFLMGCGSTSNTVDAGPNFPSNPPLTLNEDRPARVYAPPAYDPEQSYPLVILLHGFGSDGEQQNIYLGLSTHVSDKQFILLTPNGTMNSGGRRFWNGTPACCDTDETGVDDVGYVRALIAEAKETINVDHDRVYTLGHSNGGFLSYRLACEAADVITGIATIAGSTFNDPAECQPATPGVSLLAVHGTADDTILFDGLEAAYPGAEETVARHAAIADCDTENPTTPANIDVLSGSNGDETVVTRYETGCTGGVEAELWAMEGGTHVPFNFSPEFIPMVLDWLFDHSR